MGLIRDKLEYKEFRNSKNDFTLRSLLGKDIRKTLDKLDQYEQQLINDIDNGTFTELIISKKEVNKTGKEIIYYKTVLK